MQFYDYDAWLESTAAKLEHMLDMEHITESIVSRIYADQKKSNRELEDFDFLLNEPNRVEWVDKAFEYAVKYDLDIQVGIMSFDSVFDMLRAVRVHRKSRRKPKT